MSATLARPPKTRLPRLTLTPEDLAELAAGDGLAWDIEVNGLPCMLSVSPLTKRDLKFRQMFDEHGNLRRGGAR
jgi:hypothetical protein